MYISENHSLLAPFKKTTKHRRCYEKCGKCKLPWNETNTLYVHLTKTKDNKDLYICDTCKDKVLKIIENGKGQNNPET